MTPPKINLQEIRERCDRATPGPWRHDASLKGQIQRVSPADDGPRATVKTDLGLSVAFITIVEWHEENRSARPDADFIAHARTDIPALLDWIERAVPVMRSALILRRLMIAGFDYIPDSDFTGPSPADELQELLAEIGIPSDAA